MARRAKAQAGGAPAWMVTFADLMSLLVCFFVLIISFSIMDDEKLQVVAGSMKDAFGIQKDKAVTGIVEIFGNPFFDFQKLLSPTTIPLVTMAEPNETEDPRDATHDDTRAELQQEEGQEEGTYSPERSEQQERLEELAQIRYEEEQKRLEKTEAQLNKALEETPGVAELKDNVTLEMTPQGLRIQLLDQEDEPMFAMGSARLLERPRRLIALIAQAAAKLPNKLSISGHTDALAYRSSKQGYNNWNLSSDRALATRLALVDAGLDQSRIDSVTGRADAEPLFPEDPYDPRNRRISIVILSEHAPPPDAPPAR
jgi:chemotaxis protein MotB